MSITTRQLEIIRAVILSGSVTNAASQLGISQPAVSRLLKDCEERIGFALFIRKQGRLQPTSEASALLPELNRVFESVERLQRQAEELRELQAGSIRIATTPVLADTLLPRAIQSFLARHPKVQLNIRNMLNTEVVERVAMDDADLGLVLSPDNYRGSTVMDLHQTELIGIVPMGHPLVAKGRIDLDDAMHFPLISFSRSLPLGAALDRLFQQRGQQRRVAIEVSQSTTALSMVRQGIGIAFVDPFILIGEKPSGIVRLKLATRVPIAAQLLIPHHEQISRLSKTLVKHIRAAIAELVATRQI